MGDELRFNSRFNGNTLKGTAVMPKGSVSYSKGQPELDSGYEKYNIDDEGSIYIAKMPDRALFNDGEPVFVQAKSGVFVGSNWKQPETKTEGKAPAKSSNPRDLFSNIQRGFECDIRTHVGTYDKGRVVEQKPLTDFVSRMNERMVSGRTSSVESMSRSCTSSRAEPPKVDMRSGEFNTDNVQVKPLEKPKVSKKFTFVNGKLVMVEVKEPKVQLGKESVTVSN